MPRVYAPRRTQIAVRLNPGGLAQIDQLAVADGVTRVEMIRRLLAEAVAVRLHGSRRGNPTSATRTEKPTSAGL